MTYSFQTFSVGEVLTAAKMNQVEVNIRDKPRGIQTIWVPAGAMVPRTTNGAAVGTAELTSNRVMRKTLDFDAATAEYAQFQIKMPKGWDEGTIQARFVWTAASGSGSVIWGFQGLAHGDDDALDAAFGTAQTASDTLLLANDVHLTSATAATTMAGTPAENDLVTFQVYRDAANGSDTLGVDALLLGVELLVNFNTQDDS